MSDLFDWRCEICRKTPWNEIILGRMVCFHCGDKISPYLYDWPGCIEPIVCCSGNVNGAYVCKNHFHITNGLPADGQKEFLPQMLAMAEIEQTRQAFNL